MPSYTKHVITMGLVIGCLGGILLAQGTTVSMLGTVYDQSQAVLPGVTVTATKTSDGQVRTGVTDDEGRYVMAQMRIGTYGVEVELPGFQTTVQEVILGLGGNTVTNFTLSVGVADTQVVVTSEAALVNTTGSSVRNLVSTRQIRDLPLAGRSFTDLVALESGVTLDYLTGTTQIGLEGNKISISGSRLRQSLFTLDGTDMRNSKGSTPGSLSGGQLGVDTVEQFTVITSVANAEYGVFSGGVISAVTKSGTNEFHGSVFEYHRNSALDARNFFDRDPDNPLERSDPPGFKLNQYGFTLGGPIQQDKIFFFGSFEGLNTRQAGTTTSVVPSLDARNGFIPDIGQLVLSPNTAPILNAYPEPNSTVRSDGGADYIFAAPTKIDQQYYIGKVDWQINDADSISGRYIFDNADRERPQNIDVVFNVANTRSQYYLVEWKRVVSPTVINEARVSMNRFILNNTYEDRKPLPDIMLWNPAITKFDGTPWKGTVRSSVVSQLGFSSTRAQLHVLNHFQYVDNLTITRGAHSLKTGFNIHRYQLNNTAGGFGNGGYTFNSLADLIEENTPDTFTGTLTPLKGRGMRETIFGFYFQDDWRAGPNVTVNLGVRYEPASLVTEVAGRLGTLRNAVGTTFDSFITAGNPLYNDNPTWSNFAPRVGFAWDLFGDGKTSLRAGYGLFYELMQPLHYWSSIHNNPPEIVGITVNDPIFPDVVSSQLESGEPLFFRDGDIVTMNIDNVAPWAVSDVVEQAGVHQWNLSIDRELMTDLVVNVKYTGSHGYNLGHLLDRNTAVPETDANGVFPFYPADSERRNPSWARVRDTAWDASSWYHSVGVNVDKRFSRGYSLKGSYTFGKSMDNGSATSVGESRSNPNGMATIYEDIDFDKGTSDFSVRQRMTMTGSWELPFASNNPILGGWVLNGILTAAEGSRETIAQSSRRNNSRSRQVPDSPDRVSIAPGADNNPVLSDGRDPNLYYDPLVFITGPAGYYGNLGRNTIIVPGVLAMDLSIQKNFTITEATTFQFRAEMFNIANRANFRSPSTAVFTSSGRRSSTAGRITATTTTSRQYQFALKILF